MLSYSYGDDARHGGADATLSLTPEQAEALGVDLCLIVEAVDTVLAAIAAHRGAPQPADTLKGDRENLAWHEWVLTDTTQLQCWLDGVRAATIRAHHGLDGSHGERAKAMGIRRNTAAARTKVVVDNPPSGEEQCVVTPATPGEGTRPGQPPITARFGYEGGSTVVNRTEGADSTPHVTRFRYDDGSTVINCADGGNPPLQTGHIHGDIRIHYHGGQ